MEKTVYNVTRATASGKYTNIGDYDTVHAAQFAMIEHYKQTPRRGKFYYIISQQEVKEISGVSMRIQCLVLSGESRPYYHKFTADELKAM